MLRLLAALFLALLSGPVVAQQAAPQTPGWPFAASDLPPDPDWRFGTLPNGLRYLIRANATPAAQGSVQLWIGSGALDEHDAEQGLAHFIEHMAFNGSTHVPEGEMVRLLEREGLAFGADTNASTGYEATIYRLDLPRNDPALLGTALMLMRETASELLFDPEAIDRERGVVLSEMRVRDTYAWRDNLDNLQFLYPGARFAHRLPIGTAQVLRSASAATLRGLWQRLYRPDNAALVVVGDFDPDAVETAVRDRFADWQAAPAPAAPSAGPVPTALAGLTDIHLDPALPERVTVARHGPWLDGPDTVARRQRALLRQVGYAIVNRRLQRLARLDDPPLKGAGFGTGDVFRAGRTTRLIVDAADGEWPRALAAAQAEYRRALAYGFSPGEVAEQVAQLRTAQENAAAGAATRTNAAFVAAALDLLNDDRIPTTPASSLARFEAFAPGITPEAVLAAMQEEAVPLTDPLIRFQGRTEPVGGAAALRAAWDEGMSGPIARADIAAVEAWAYQDFGTPGTVTADSTVPQLGIRTLTFANGLRLNLKRTDLAADRIAVQLNIDGGQLLDTVDDPLATAMTSVLPVGGLGRHPADELQTILSGRSVDFAIGAAEETFRLAANTTPRDLELQLQLMAAAISDPGYRPQGEAQYRRNMADAFAALDATPEAALANNLGAITSGGDPRFSLQPKDAYLALTFAQLRAAIADRLANGALELALVGDFEEERAIALVAATLGALPARESDFRPYSDNRSRSFTDDRSPRTLTHAGPADQAILRLSWPTTDDSDQREVLRLELLERIMRLELTDSLREALGQTYSPRAGAVQSGTYPGYGEFAISAAIATDQLDATRAAMRATIARLAAMPVDADELLRARQPLLEAYANALKGNAGWMALADRAQSEPEDLARFQAAPALIAAITPEEIRVTAARYLDPAQALEIAVLPRSADEPAS